jgi:hypothetical protein
VNYNKKHDIEYMIVGGYAVAFHGFPLEQMTNVTQKSLSSNEYYEDKAMKPIA